MSKAADNGRKVVRCAIYTRKSTEEGLEQTFNTLDAQREACEAYIKSQTGEGWRALPAHYDDGGFSGGNMDRPALKRLLQDIEAGKIDTIVVYKVDRLTRSLMDFAKIVEKLDERNVSFVSVTQAFNTTTSMGRLTLNVLLSFAQFEREVTGERIRDKVAASKAKGMWMGGNVPLGYDLGDRVLVVNQPEARQVVYMFERYLALGSVPSLVKELREVGISSKRWVARSGKQHGGVPLRCGAVYYILQNRLYLGEVVHRGKSFAGEHGAIVPEALFTEVQRLLAANRKQRRETPARAATCPLLGRIFDADGTPMRASFSYGRGGKCYRYYISGSSTGTKEPGRIERVAATGLERWITKTLVRLLGPVAATWPVALEVVQRVEIHRRGTHLLLDAQRLGEPHERVGAIIERLTPLAGEDRLVPETGGLIRLIADRRAIFRGGPREPAPVPSSQQHERLEEMLRSAHKLLEGHRMSPLEPANHTEAVAPEYQRLRRTMAMGLLAPDLQREILERRSVITPEDLIGNDLPLAWADQRAALARVG